jgi:hypothetical protein
MLAFAKLACSAIMGVKAEDRSWCHPMLQELIYPQLYRYILHPCVSWPGQPNMCGGLHTATGCLRFDSFLTQKNVVIMLIYEVGLPLFSGMLACSARIP